MMKKEQEERMKNHIKKALKMLRTSTLCSSINCSECPLYRGNKNCIIGESDNLLRDALDKIEGKICPKCGKPLDEKK